MSKFKPIFSPGVAAALDRNAEAHAIAEHEAQARRAAAIVKRRASRMYAGARLSRLTSNWQVQNSSSDSELFSSLTLMRSRARQLVRDNSYAKRAKTIVVNNIIGSGIYFEAQARDDQGALIEAVNDEVEAEFAEWSRPENCHTGGKLHFCDLERHAFGQIFEAGEVILRMRMEAFGNSKVPLALEIVEAEKIADEFTTPISDLVGYYRMGVERDVYGRPTAYWLRKWHPDEIRYATGDPNMLDRVTADQIFHLYSVDRWPQTRGEPWLHTAMRRLNDMDGYSEAEITAARGAACYMGFIETPDEQGFADTPADEEKDTPPEFELEPGAVPRLAPGEKYVPNNPNRPNTGMDPFMRMMLREVAAGTGASYESLSRDYSQGNYSSQRIAMLDDRDLWKVFQNWFVRSFREPFHRVWIQQAVLARALKTIPVGAYSLNPRKFDAVTFKPRGWSWIDPVKEVQAYKDARRAGFITTQQILSQTGAGDAEDVFEQLAKENAMARDEGLVLTSDPSQILEGRETDVTAEPPADPAKPGAGATDPNADDDAQRSRVVAMKTVRP